MQLIVLSFAVLVAVCAAKPCHHGMSEQMKGYMTECGKENGINSKEEMKALWRGENREKMDCISWCVMKKSDSLDEAGNMVKTPHGKEMASLPQETQDCIKAHQVTSCGEAGKVMDCVKQWHRDSMKNKNNNGGEQEQEQ